MGDAESFLVESIVPLSAPHPIRRAILWYRIILYVDYFRALVCLVADYDCHQLEKTHGTVVVVVVVSYESGQ